MTPDLDNMSHPEPESEATPAPPMPVSPVPTRTGSIPVQPSPAPAADVDLARAVARLPKTDPARFTVRHIGAGYDRAEIDEFLGELNEAIDGVRSAVERDRRELDELRAENARLSATADAKLDEEVTLGAVDLLSQAQTIADKAVADAEQYARDLVLAAREEYRDVLERAARAEDAHAHAAPGPGGAPAVPQVAMPEIEYVRTYAQVAQVQLRSVLEALAEQVDRLGTLPQTGGDAASPMPTAEHDADDDPIDAEPDWLPAVPPEPALQRQTYIKP